MVCLNNKKNMHQYITKRLRSFVFAQQGQKYLIKNEPNAIIHIIIGLIAIIAGFAFDISTSEWLVIIISIGLVIGFEIINTSIEKLADHVSPKWNEDIKVIKDLGAAAVLITALAAFVVGLIIFIPKVL